MANILIVDDEEKIRNLIEIYLKREGLTVFHAEDGIQALDVLEDTKIDLIICDVMMPHMNGYEFIESLRKSKFETLVLMITAKGELEDKRVGFDLGVDDYMVKPFDLEELVFRVKALLKRSNINVIQKIELDNFSMDEQSYEIISNSTVYTLPPKEFSLLFKLLSSPNIIFTRQDLMDDIWGYDSDADERTVDVHIKRLREKFKDHEAFDLITIRGLGYKGVLK